MAISTYKLGKVLIEGASVVTGFISGTANITHNIEDTNPIGSSWREGTVLGGEWDVSLEFHYDPADTVQAALMTDVAAGGASCMLSSVSLYTLAASFVCSGSCIVTNATVTKAVGATDKLSVTLRGNGAVAYA